MATDYTSIRDMIRTDLGETQYYCEFKSLWGKQIKETDEIVYYNKMCHGMSRADALVEVNKWKLENKYIIETRPRPKE